MSWRRVLQGDFEKAQWHVGTKAFLDEPNKIKIRGADLEIDSARDLGQPLSFQIPRRFSKQI